MKIVILEDEKVAARRLQRMVRSALDQEVEITLFTTLEDGLEYIDHAPLDLLLLDLNLNGDDGFEVLQKVVENPFDTIVVSANTDRAIEAFELGVIDFVPKPYDQERFNKAIKRFVGRQSRRGGTETLVVKNQGRRQFIPVDTIAYIQGAGDYTEVHCDGGEVVLHTRSLEGIQEILPETFIRIHKSFLVEKERIAELKVYGAGRYGALLQSGKELPVSRSRYKEHFGEAQR